MNVTLNYGGKKQTVNIPDPCDVLHPKTLKIQHPTKILKKAFDHPIQSSNLSTFLKNSEKVLVLVNDAMRPTRTALVLEHIQTYLESHENIEFLLATGSHRPPTIDELKKIFGSLYQKYKDRISINEAKKKSLFEFIGTTSRGTPVYFNKKIRKIKNILVIGSLEPHYFAGYTGGRKSFLPGVSSYETIESNHKLALNEQAKPLQLEGNPVHEDMIEAVDLLKDINIFSIQLVLNAENEIFASTTGNLHASFVNAIPYVNQLYKLPIEKKKPLVITVASAPLDITLYQSQKAIEHGKLALQEGGILILVAQCNQGIGNSTFHDVLCSADSPESLVKKLGEEYRLGYHKAAKIAHLSTKSQIWAVTDLDDHIIQQAMMFPYHDLQIAVNDAVKTLKSKGIQPESLVLSSGSLTIPSPKI